jgi:hypothetical protein
MSFLSRLFTSKPRDAVSPTTPWRTLPPEALPFDVDEFDYLRPQWPVFYEWLAEQPAEEAGEWRTAAVHRWLSAMVESQPDRWRIAESAQFLLLHPANLAERPAAYLDVLEKLVRRLTLTLPQLAQAPLGKLPVLLFATPDHYHRYVAHYYPEYGVYGLSGGMFLGEGGGHIALPWQGFHMAEPVLAHELTHAALRKRRLPRWLDEGLAVAFEQANYPHPSRETPFERQRKHRTFWTEASMQRFWSGEAFFDPDEHQPNSYELAQTLVAGLSTERERFLAFVAQAKRSDGGEGAAQAVLGVSLSDAVGAYLGEGDWAPRVASS